MHIRWQNAESLSILLGPGNTLFRSKKKMMNSLQLEKDKKRKDHK